MTTVAIMQPSFLGWVGYYDLVDQADAFILDDLSQFVAKSWHSRNRILGRDGNVVWLTIPVHCHRAPLYEIEVAGDAWRQKHWRTIESAYGHAPGWLMLEDAIEWAYRHDEWDCFLASFTSYLIQNTADTLGISTPIIRASSLGPTRPGMTERLVDYCGMVNADVLLDTPGAQAFLTAPMLAPIRIDWHRYEPAYYSQGDQPWHPYLSVIDLIAWHGTDALSIIRQGRHTEATTGAMRSE